MSRLTSIWVEVKWANNTKAHYVSQGYTFTRTGDKFQVKPEHLPGSSGIKIKVLCDCGREDTTSWYSFAKKQNKNECRECGRFATLTIEFIRAEFRKRGYTLITEYYINAHQHLEYICEKHPEHVQKIIYNSLQRGCGCHYCALEKRANQRQLTVEKAQQVTEDAGFIFLWIECNPLSSKSDIFYICPKHPDLIQTIGYNTLQQGSGCILCYKERRKAASNNFYNGYTEFKYMSQYARSYIKQWYGAVGAEANGYCEVSGQKSDGDFVVHHLTSSDTILRGIYQKLGLDPKLCRQLRIPYELAQEIVAEYVEAHKGTKGALLAPEVHKLFHKVYGNRRNTPEQFEEFKQR
jgi:hypothetical protein